MSSIASSWQGLDLRRRVVVIGATLAVFAAVLLLGRSAAQPEMALLYSGLEPRASGDVVAALEQAGVAHEVRGTGIYVPVTERDSLRMVLAGQGLPANSSQGYELLDELSGFGTTSQMFDAAYWRAKEGELARTIVASPLYRAARVHVSTPSSRPFAREARTTASVTLTPSGGAVTGAQARAIRYLVASAVSGLDPEDVAVIDGEDGRLAEGGGTGEGTRPADRAEALRLQAERLLEARVGQGNALVEVSLETVTESEQIVERRVDPDSRVAISTDVEERTNTEQGGAGGDVTVASNLPDGQAGTPGATESSQSSETRETTNYEVSETSRELVRTPGAVKRLTVAVLVNDVETVAADGTVERTPRPDEELAALGELVASAVGLDESRGDVLTIRSLPLEPVPEMGTEVTEGGAPLDMMSLIQLGVLALVALILGLFVVRPILARGGGATALPAPDGPGGTEEASPLDMSGAGGGFAFPMMSAFDAAEDAEATMEPQDPVSRLRRLIEERQDDSLRLLQSWIESPEGDTRHPVRQGEGEG
ncbi:flagellar basal-body MS-ring/collar protein FliF [Wenxinia saemankumensis]|uniref:flagellar basal-body MS-ring/collar protein FliF n=1 Tax=Wenxinia saemankumensis TaxID=1447782 RepID=UPI001115232D|nr:flagellar basal-body MS-ring/collar protein FliF [Wenxinia saemankumensis]